MFFSNRTKNVRKISIIQILFRVNLEEKHYRHKLEGFPEGNWTLVDPSDPDHFWNLNFSRDDCIYIYASLTVITVLVTLSRSFMFFNFCMRASVVLHNNMFESISKATMRFFNTNPSGRILNRFSKDMGVIDETIPKGIIDCLQVIHTHFHKLPE